MKRSNEFLTWIIVNIHFFKSFHVPQEVALQVDLLLLEVDSSILQMDSTVVLTIKVEVAIP